MGRRPGGTLGRVSRADERRSPAAGRRGLRASAPLDGGRDGACRRAGSVAVPEGLVRAPVRIVRFERRIGDPPDSPCSPVGETSRRFARATSGAGESGADDERQRPEGLTRPAHRRGRERAYAGPLPARAAGARAGQGGDDGEGSGRRPRPGDDRRCGRGGAAGGGRPHGVRGARPVARSFRPGSRHFWSAQRLVRWRSCSPCAARTRSQRPEP